MSLSKAILQIESFDLTTYLSATSDKSIGVVKGSQTVKISPG